jgi:hypothetical protein
MNTNMSFSSPIPVAIAVVIVAGGLISIYFVYHYARRAAEFAFGIPSAALEVVKLPWTAAKYLATELWPTIAAAAGSAPSYDRLNGVLATPQAQAVRDQLAEVVAGSGWVAPAISERERLARYPWLRPGEPWRPRANGDPMPGQPSPY